MQLKNNHYWISGVKALSICEEFDTPVYVYDADKIKEQYTKLNSSFPGVKLKIKYACKALSNIAVLQLLRNEGAGLDTVSIQEVLLGIEAGFKPGEILYTPNCVSFEEIQMAVEIGVTINLDNLSVLEHFGQTYGSTVPCCIRLNPHIMAGGNQQISVGHIDSKFGISIYQIPLLKRIVDAYKIKINGLHMHTGSDILDAEVFLQGADLLYDAASHFPDLQFLDFGSGFKVAYREGDYTADIKSIGKKISKSFQKFCKTYGRELELWFEPGKFIVSEAGYLLVKTNVVKQTTSTVFAGVDSGQNHLIRPMFYDAYHQIINISNPKGHKRVYSVVGYICETDTLGYNRQLNEVREGDILAICNAGAYAFSMSSNYNSRFRPCEVLVYNGKAHLIRKRETIEDLLRNQVPMSW